VSTEPASTTTTVSHGGTHLRSRRSHTGYPHPDKRRCSSTVHFQTSTSNMDKIPQSVGHLRMRATCLVSSRYREVNHFGQTYCLNLTRLFASPRPHPPPLLWICVCVVLTVAYTISSPYARCTHTFSFAFLNQFPSHPGCRSSTLLF
jgi:hypothetical protein